MRRWEVVLKLRDGRVVCNRCLQLRQSDEDRESIASRKKCYEPVEVGAP